MRAASAGVRAYVWLTKSKMERWPRSSSSRALESQIFRPALPSSMARNRPRKLSQTEAPLSLIRIERLGSRLELRKAVRHHVLHGYAYFATEQSYVPEHIG